MSRLALASALLLSLSLVAARAANSNPGVLPPNSNPYGKSYGQWADAFWQWTLGIPFAQNPTEDATGQFAGVGQSGKVWFLAGSFGDLPSPVVRNFSMPNGTALFLPVYQWIFGATVGDCEPSNPGVTCDVPTLKASAAAAATSILVMEVWIDGVPVKNLRDYRAFSPSSFSVTLPPGNVLENFGFPDPAGTYSPQVDDGYWLMIAPLPPGRHNITVHLVPDPNFGSEQLVVYNITVLRGKSLQAQAE
jgi:hypothetical protein